MITEDYVSFEVAKLLKEKGFSEKTIPFYNGDGSFCSRIGNVCQPYDWNHDKFVFFSAPTHQMAMAWLRGKGIFIQIGVVGHSTITVPEKYYFFKVYRDRKFISHNKVDTYYTYEEVVESALKYCLEEVI